jgi:hypothetical protein
MTDPARLCWCGKPLLVRRELPQRRGGENFEFIVGRTKFTASVRRESRRTQVTEIFVNGPKVDSDVDVTIRDAAVVISIALQYGISASELANSTGRNPDASAASPIGAILDILAREEK